MRKIKELLITSLCVRVRLLYNLVFSLLRVAWVMNKLGKRNPCRVVWLFVGKKQNKVWKVVFFCVL